MDWAKVQEFVRSTYAISGNVNIQPYSYRVAFQNLAAGTTQNGKLDANANSDFILLSPRYRATEAADVDAIPEVRVLLTDTGSSTQLSDSAIDLTTFFGHIGKAPVEMVYPRIIAGRSSLQIQVTNYGATAYTNLELTFAGVLVQAYN